MAWTYDLVIPRELDGQTIRACMQTWLLPKRIQGQLRQGRRIRLNHAPASVAARVHTADHLQLTFLPTDLRTPNSSYLPDSAATVRVLYQNTDLLVVNKPAGTKSHPNQPGEVGSILNHLAAYLDPTPDAPYMVHRLDQMTSGAMLVALNPVVVPILDRLISEKVSAAPTTPGYGATLPRPVVNLLIQLVWIPTISVSVGSTAKLGNPP